MRYASIAALVGLLLGASNAAAGILLSPSGRYVNFAFRPDGEMDTVNYYGVGAGVTAGYSIMQLLDIAGVMQLGRGRVNPVVNPESRDAEYSFFGGEIAARLNQTVYIAARGGTATRTLNNQKLDTETPGSWSGNMIGGSIGGIIPAAGKSAFNQISVSFMSGPLMSCGSACPENATKKRLEMFTVDLSYVYNAAEKGGIDESPIGEFVKDLLTWR